jgi:putative transposase/transposase-like zinc-binding protein
VPVGATPAAAGVADVFRRFAGGYEARYGAAVLPSHRRAIADIIACRTEALGADLWCCPQCGTLVPVFHSCKNRHCPQCNGARTQAWLEQRQAEILPIPYFHVTVTVPKQLRAALRSHQTAGYGALMKAAAESIIKLARDPRWVGGTVGVLAVLHTWTQQLHLHPHVHCLVTGGGLSDADRCWHSAEKKFLFPTKALGKLVRTQFRNLFNKLCPDISLPPHTWRRPWVVHLTPWSEGKATLEYFARYAFRIAITDRRIIRVDDTGVTFRYKDRAADCHRTGTLSGEEFVRRFLQHVLPQGFHKLRYYGLWHPARRHQLDNLRNAMLLERPAPPSSSDTQPDEAAVGETDTADKPRMPTPLRLCTQCGQAYLVKLPRAFPASPLGP